MLRARFAPPAGRVHDLREHLREQNALWFGGRFRGRIGWAPAGRGRVRRSIRLGSWNPHHRLIRIHPVLDSRDVPSYVLAFIVFHEMLHAMDRTETERSGRRSHHGRRFREREAEHTDRQRAESWIQENVHDLLSW